MKKKTDLAMLHSIKSSLGGSSSYKQVGEIQGIQGREDRKK
jgi:hypothetical protein